MNWRPKQRSLIILRPVLVQQQLLCLLLVIPCIQSMAFSRCYGRLEHALDDMLYKSASRSQFRSLIDLSDYRKEYDFPPEAISALGKSLDWNSETRASEVEDLLQQFQQQQHQHRPNYPAGPNKYSNVIQPSRVEVSNVKFRVPRNAKWVN